MSEICHLFRKMTNDESVFGKSSKSQCYCTDNKYNIN